MRIGVGTYRDKGQLKDVPCIVYFYFQLMMHVYCNECDLNILLQKVELAQKRSFGAAAAVAYLDIGSVITTKIAATEATRMNTCAVSLLY